MSIYSRLPSIFQILNHPASSTVIALLGIVLLWGVTKDVPRPVTLYGANYHEPLPKKKHPVVRIGLISFGSAVLCAIAYLGYHRWRSANAVVATQSPPVQSIQAKAEPVDPTKQKGIPVPKDHVGPQKYRKADPAPTASLKPAEPPKLPIEPLVAPVTMDEPITAFIGNTRISAKDKTATSVYVAIQISAITKYRGDIEQHQIDGAIEAIRRLKGVSVFFTDNGNYNLRVRGTTYGFGLIADQHRAVFYLDKGAEIMAGTIQHAMVEFIGATTCQYFGVQPANKDTPINVPADFMAASGLDIAVMF